MISICKRDVPEYLHSSPHFSNAFEGIDDGDEATIEIPANCLKPNPSVRIEEDLCALLFTVRFWLVPEQIETPDVFAFALKDKFSFSRAVQGFEEDFPLLAKLRSLVQDKEEYSPMGCVAKWGMLSFVKSWQTGTGWPFTSLAAHHGQLGCLQYAIESGCKPTMEECNVAAKAGQLACLKYMHGRGVRVTLRDTEQTITAGHLECVKYLIESKAVPPSSNFAVVAARAGNVEMLTYLLSAGCAAIEMVANAAAANDHLDCLKLLRDKGCPLSPDTLYHAVHCGSILCVEYLRSIGCDWEPQTLQLCTPIRVAEARGRLHESFPTRDLLSTFMYAAEHGCPVTQHSMTLAVSLKSVPFVKHLHDRGLSLNPTAFQIAVMRGVVNCMQYFLDHGYVARTDDYLLAIRHTHIDSVRCLHEHGVAWNASLTSAALLVRQADILHYLLQHGCPAADDLMLSAISKKSVLCMQVIHTFGTPLTEAMVTTAVTVAAVDCLEYALSKGCPVPVDTAVLAASLGHVQCLELLHKHGARMTPAVFNAALQEGHFKCVAFVVMHGCKALGPIACAAAVAKNKSFHVLKHLRAKGTQWDSNTCLSAVRNNAFEVLKYTVKNGCPTDDCVLMREAALLGRVDMLKWLYKKGVAWDARTTAAAVQRDNVDCLMYAIQRQCPFEVPSDVLVNSHRCHIYMVNRGHQLVQRALAREQLKKSIATL